MAEVDKRGSEGKDMSENEYQLQLSRNIEHYLAVLSKLYANDGQNELQEIIVNSQIRVREGCGYENIGGITYGHALYLVMPEILYISAAKKKDKLQKQIRDDLNKAHNVQDEFIENVFLEMEFAEERDWRKESGKLLAGKRAILPEAVNRIWGKDGYRLFLSHKTEVKKETAELKEKLKLFGISGFVAHEDIRPNKEWQNEIENALFSMDAFGVLMTENFHDSDWTDQEVGFAFGQGVPVISIKLGKDPYGFIGKFQAISCSWDTVAKEIVKILMPHDRMLNAYIEAIRGCREYDDANPLSELLPFIKRISNQQASNLISAFNKNVQVRDSYGFNGKYSGLYGAGLIPHLCRLTDKRYRFSRSREIEVIP
jgi:hypothetical protein